MAYETKVCSICKLEKNISEFYFLKKRNKYEYKCKVCRRVYLNKWAIEHPNNIYDYGRKRNYKKRYDITIDQYNNLFKKQNGCCAICGKHQTEIDRKLFIDHNHINGEVRGLLCQKCNFLISQAEDNYDTLIKAAEYVRSKV